MPPTFPATGGSARTALTTVQLITPQITRQTATLGNCGTFTCQGPLGVAAGPPLSTSQASAENARPIFILPKMRLAKNLIGQQQKRTKK